MRGAVNHRSNKSAPPWTITAPGSVQRVREATESVVVEIGLILAALAVLVPPTLALFNLKEDPPTPEP
ncbi:hypothetical protein [Nesterenkonia rhizosphaerae]|uniref:Uncharacterized protein n=1 Tax=Nesterenkonia rhizosphaerae TaxID=1348272 RepID=A0ABP9G682_9MICC